MHHDCPNQEFMIELPGSWLIASGVHFDEWEDTSPVLAFKENLKQTRGPDWNPDHDNIKKRNNL